MSALPPLFVEIGAKIGDLQAALTEASGEITKFGKTHDDTMSSMQQTGKLAAAAISVIGGAAIAAGAKAVQMASSFQESQELLVTGAGESQSALKSVSDGVLAMAGEVGISAQNLSDGLYKVESAGYHGADGLTVLKAAAQGADVGNADLTTVADGLTTVLNAYGLKASDSAKITSQMVAAVGAGKMTMDDFSSSLSAVLPKASAAGISFQDVAADMATMTGQGTSAGEAAQELANSISELQTPTSSMRDELSQVGLDSQQVASQLGQKGLSGTMTEISSAIMQHMGPAGVQLQSVFNQSAQASQDATTEFKSLGSAAQQLASGVESGTTTMQQWRTGVKALPADQAALATQWKSMYDQSQGFNDTLKSGGASVQTYSQALQKATGDSSAMQVALQLTGSHAGQLSQNLKTVSGATTDASGNVQGFAQHEQTAAARIADAKAALSAAGTAIGSDFLPAVGKAAEGLASLSDFMMKHKAIAEALIIVFGGLAAAVGVLTLVNAIMAASEMAAFWPVLIVIGGITLLTVAIVELATHWSQVWHAVKDVAESVGHALGDFFSDLWTMIVGGVIGFGAGLYNGFVHIWNDVVGFFNGLWGTASTIGGNIVRGIANGISGARHWVIDEIEHLASDALGTIKSFFGIHSPSTVMDEEVGQQLSAGLAQGVARGAGGAVGAVTTLSGDLIAAARTAIVTPGSLGTLAPIPTASQATATAGAAQQGTVQVQVPLQVDIDGQRLFKQIQTIALQWQIRNGVPAFSVGR